MTQIRSVFRTGDARRRIIELYDRVLEGWTFPFAIRTVETTHGTTFTIEAGGGAGAPVVLLHGSGGNALTWAADIPVLARSRKVYAVDIVGEPGKSADRRIGWDGDAHTAWFDSLLDGLGCERVVLVGISYGGWIALEYAVRRPGRIERLALVCPGGLVNAKASYMFRLVAYMLQGERGKKKLKQMFFGDTELAPEFEEFIAICGASFEYRPGAPPVLPDIALAALTMPVMYLAGEKDFVFDSRRAATRLSKANPAAVIRIIKERSHVFTETASELAAFIA
jgi:pimeloyl-ACP methyl ester carboxylesterase